MLTHVYLQQSLLYLGSDLSGKPTFVMVGFRPEPTSNTKTTFGWFFHLLFCDVVLSDITCVTLLKPCDVGA